MGNPKTTVSILLIENDEGDQLLIKKALSSLGFSDNLVVTAHNGEEGLTYLTSNNPQPFLILCDVNMPKMTGLELREKISKDESLLNRSIPFIFFSSSASAESVKLAFKYTVQGYFEKPMNYPELIDILRIIINYWKECKHPNTYNL